MLSVTVSKPALGSTLQRLAFVSLLLFVSVASGQARAVAPGNVAAASSTPYFNEIPGAIPDQSSIWTQYATPVFAHVATLDISHDGLDDMVFHFWKNAVGTNPATAIACTNRLVILIQKPDHTFVDETSTWLNGTPDLGACSADVRVDDVNADGYPDVVFASSQEDGRDTSVYSKMFSPVFMLVSGADGKYTREQIGTPAWYHMVGTGRDASNKAVVAIAALVGQDLVANASEVYQRTAGGTWTNVSAGYPQLNAGAFSLFNAAGQSGPSDTLIQPSVVFSSTTALDIGGATRDGAGVWHTVPNLNLFDYVGSLTFINWQGNPETYPVYKLGETYLTGGFWLESCQFRMSPGAPATTIIKLSEMVIRGGYTGPGQVISGADVDNITRLYGFRIVTGALQRVSLPISGEVIEAMDSRFFACRDLNGDNYDDIAVYPIADYPINDNGLPFVYLNDKGGGLHYIGLSQYPSQPNDYPDQPPGWKNKGRTSVLHDFDHDGIDDLLTWPGSGVNVGYSRDLSFHYYKGLAYLQAPLSPPSLSIANASVSEGDAGTKLATFTVTLSDSVGDVSFDIATSDGMAFAGSDYVSKNVVGQLIPAGQTSATFTVTINGDTEVESNETFTVNLGNVMGATLLNSQALGTINNDDSATLSIADVSVVEGNSGIATASFAVTLSQPMPSPVRFDIGTSDGTASAGTDYLGRSQAGRMIDAGRTRQVFEVTVNGDTTPEANETILVTVSNVVGATLADGSATGTIGNDDAAAAVVSAAVATAPIPVPIHAIQGAGTVSAWQGRDVTTSGIVTALTAGGFFLQASGVQVDADPRTSEGIVVASAGTAVRVGDVLRVSGRVQEARVGATSNQRTLTRMVATRIVVLGRGSVLPDPVVLDLAHPGVDPTTALLERLEGMRVALPSLRVVGPVEASIDDYAQTARSTGRFYAVAQGGRRGNDPASLDRARPDANAERLLVDSAGQRGAPALSADAGDTIAGLVGVLSDGGGVYQVLPDAGPAPRIASAAAPRPVTAARSGTATIGSFNLRRLLDDSAIARGPSPTGAAYATRLAKTANVICAYARNPDILALQGLQNQAALAALARSVNANDGNLLFPGSCTSDPAYQAYLPPGRWLREPQPGFLVSGVSVRPGVARVEVLSVTRATAPRLFRHPDGQGEALSERPPLILQARINDADGRSLRVTVIDAYLTELASDADRPGVHGWTTQADYLRAKRSANVAWLAELVQARQRRDASENLVVLGNFEASELNDGRAVPSSPVSPPLTNLTTGLPVSERYTVVREGNTQAVDHLMVNAAMLQSSPEEHLEVARINADFGEDTLGDITLPMRVSDHDPIVGYFDLR